MQAEAEAEAITATGTTVTSPAPSHNGSLQSHGHARRAVQSASAAGEPTPRPSMLTGNAKHAYMEHKQGATRMSAAGRAQQADADSNLGVAGPARLDALLAEAEAQAGDMKLAATPLHTASSQGAQRCSSSNDGASSLAATFCQEVKSKIKKLQQEVDRRDASISNLHVDMQRMQEQHQCAMLSVPSFKTRMPAALE